MKYNITRPGDEQHSDRAVSPVIGVILMVAITVILAAVIGTFVLNLGQSTGNAAPQASLAASDHSDSFDKSVNESNMISVSHDGGESVALDSVLIQLRYESNNSLIDEWDAPTGADPTDATNNGAYLELNGALVGSDTTLGTGDKLIIRLDTSHTPVLYNDKQDYRVTIIDKESDKSILDQVVKLD